MPLLCRYPRVSLEELYDLREIVPKLTLEDVAYIANHDDLGERLFTFFEEEIETLQIPSGRFIALVAAAIMAAGLTLYVAAHLS